MHTYTHTGAPRANHPPGGVAPNAMFYDLCCDSRDLPAASASALARIAWYAVAPLSFDGQRHVRIAFLVALRDIEDEEIFIDYQFDPNAASLPMWYTPPLALAPPIPAADRI